MSINSKQTLHGSISTTAKVSGNLSIGNFAGGGGEVDYGKILVLVENYLEENPPIIASVEQTDDGATIVITDSDGTTTATVTNGKDGVDGAPGKDGEPGAPGKDGVDGKTPVKGEDYFTEEDKLEIAEQAAQFVDIPEWAKQPEKPTYTAEEVGAATLEDIENAKEIYVGSGDPPPNVVLQIDPEGDVVVFEPVEATEEMTQPVGLDANGRLWTKGGAEVDLTGYATEDYVDNAIKNIDIPSCGYGEWRLLDTFDFSSGALSYSADTTGCKEILVVTEVVLVCSACYGSWKGVSSVYTATKSLGAIAMFNNFMDGLILATRTRDTNEPLTNIKVIYGADQTNNTFNITCATASDGILKIYGR